jgi:hypothetical protein
MTTRTLVNLAVFASMLLSVAVSGQCFAADSSPPAPLPDPHAQAEVTAPADILPVTTRETASERARLGAGRVDPFSPFMEKELPAGSAFATLKMKKLTTTGTQSREKHGFIPPPPPTVLAAPPPPTAAEPKQSFQLPEPPAKPRLADSMKLVGIIGQQALFVFTDKELRRVNKWPRTLALSPGEQFESVNLLSTDDHLATLEEDGVRTVKELPIIR